MKQCYGYIRVSTQKQGEGVSLEAQKEAITAFASRQHLAVSRWFEEKETAAKSGRRIFNQMLRDLRRGAAAGLIMHKIDRSARNLKDWATISELSDAGVDVYFATESLDFRSRGGRLTADIQAVIAADFIRNLREETVKGLNGRLNQGLYPFRAPIGYLDNGRGQPKTICPMKGPLIRELFRLYGSGQHSIRSLTAEMAARGLRNHAGRPLSKHGIETILNNPFYCGLIAIRRTGAVYDGIHEPLISVRTFERVQDVKSGKAGKKVTRHNHLYRGLFRCGLCDGPMSPERQKGYVYYRCQRPDCPTTCIREDQLAKAIEEKLALLQITAADAARLATQFEDWLQGEEWAQETRSLDLQLSRARGRQDRLTDLLIDGAISQGDYEAKRRSLALDIARLEEEQRLQGQERLDPAEVQKFLELCTSLVSLHISGNHAEKRRLVENCFSNRRVVGKNVELEPYDWLLEVQMAASAPDGDPYRPTSRTLEVKKLLEVAPEKEANDQAPQWKYNLKNQWPDDLQDAA